MIDKKAQVGETVTWVVATVIIIVILTITIIASGLIWKDKEIQSQYFSSADIITSKSFFSYLLTEDSERTIYSQVKEEGNLNENNGNRALRVFDSFNEDYSNIWLGIVVNAGENCERGKEFCILESIENDFFGSRYGGSRNTETGYHTIPHISEKINLDETKYLELVLTGK